MFFKRGSSLSKRGARLPRGDSAAGRALADASADASRDMPRRKKRSGQPAGVNGDNGKRRASQVTHVHPVPRAAGPRGRRRRSGERQARRAVRAHLTRPSELTLLAAAEEGRVQWRAERQAQRPSELTHNAHAAARTFSDEDGAPLEAEHPMVKIESKLKHLKAEMDEVQVELAKLDPPAKSIGVSRLRQDAVQGDASAQYKLALCYEQGEVATAIGEVAALAAESGELAARVKELKQTQKRIGEELARMCAAVESLALQAGV
jgi:hypothetical protein